jgi:hypothetical protein
VSSLIVGFIPVSHGEVNVILYYYIYIVRTQVLKAVIMTGDAL